MKAAILEKVGEISIKEVPRPILGANEALIKVFGCGICGTDRRLYRTGRTIKPPVILGHEISGFLEEATSKILGVSPGDPVCLEPSIYCGKCEFCRSGKYNHCKNYKIIGIQENGGFAEYVKAPVECVYPLPKNISKEEGCLIEPLAVVVHSFRIARLSNLDDILVLGSGVIGLLCVKLARRITLGKIITLTRKSEIKAKKALEFGADRVIISEKEDPIEEILKETREKGVDTIFEAAGTNDTLKIAFRVLKPGGKLISLGVFDENLNIDFNPVIFSEYQIIGSNTYSYGDFRKAIEIVSENKVDLGSLISQEIPLERLEEALKERDPEKIKIIVKP